MRRFVLDELLLLSWQEKSARRVKFHPTMTVVKGQNSTGKSCLLKTIYRTFGAEPRDVPAKWDEAQVCSFARFSIDEPLRYPTRRQ